MSGDQSRTTGSVTAPGMPNSGGTVYCPTCCRYHAPYQCVITTNIPPGPYVPVLQPVGCICPPGANKDCENPTCPRKPMRLTAMGGLK